MEAYGDRSLPQALDVLQQMVIIVFGQNDSLILVCCHKALLLAYSNKCEGVLCSLVDLFVGIWLEKNLKLLFNLYSYLWMKL